SFGVGAWAGVPFRACAGAKASAPALVRLPLSPASPGLSVRLWWFCFERASTDPTGGRSVDQAQPGYEEAGLTRAQFSRWHETPRRAHGLRPARYARSAEPKYP